MTIKPRKITVSPSRVVIHRNEIAVNLDGKDVQINIAEPGAMGILVGVWLSRKDATKLFKELGKAIGKKP